MSESQIYISLMAAMLSSLIFRLTICISYVFHFYYHVYSFVDFNQSSFLKKRKKMYHEDIILNNNILQQVHCTIFLGIIIDD